MPRRKSSRAKTPLRTESAINLEDKINARRSSTKKPKKRSSSRKKAPKASYSTPKKPKYKASPKQQGSSASTYAKLTFIVVCLLATLYMVGGKGVREFFTDSKDIVTGKFDGEWGSSDAEAEEYNSAASRSDSDNLRSDSGLLMIFAPYEVKAGENHFKCLLGIMTYVGIGEEPCRSWLAVQFMMAIFSFFLVVWGMKTYTDGIEKVDHYVTHHKTRSPGLAGFFGFQDDHTRVHETNRRVDVKRNSPLAVKFGIFCIFVVAFWSGINSLLDFDLESAGIAAIVGVTAFYLSKVSIAGNWEKKV